MGDMIGKHKRAGESVYRYLFFFYNGKITVINYEKHGEKKFRYEKREGEESFPVPDDFWDWWRKAAAYINGELVDFCFLCDHREYSILSHDFIQAESSCWTKTVIEDFFTEMQDFTHVKLISEDSGELWIHKTNQIFADNSEMIFYTNISLEQAGKVVVSQPGDMTTFARYFRGLLEEQNATKF